MNIVSKSILALAVPLAATAQFSLNPQPAPIESWSIEIDGFAAKVNDRVITRGEVNEAMAGVLATIHQQFQGPKLDEELDKAFALFRDQLIERALIMEAFKERGGMIPDQYVDDEIKRVINERFQGDETRFQQLLADQKKTRAEYAETIREEMAVGMMTNEEIGKRARVTPAQVRAEYDHHKEDYFIPEKVQYSVIVLNKGETADDLAVKRDEAEKIRQRLLAGADFSETAKEVSEGSRAAEGGAFPWMQPKDVREELREPLRALPVGEISEVIETETQLYLLKVEKRRKPGYKPFDDVRDSIKTVLTAKERERLRDRWIKRLRKNNYVVIYD